MAFSQMSDRPTASGPASYSRGCRGAIEGEQRLGLGPFLQKRPFLPVIRSRDSAALKICGHLTEFRICCTFFTHFQQPRHRGH